MYDSVRRVSEWTRENKIVNEFVYFNLSLLGLFDIYEWVQPSVFFASPLEKKFSRDFIFSLTSPSISHFASNHHDTFQMPCLESAHITMDDYFTPECLRAQLRAGHELPLLDCRSQCEFQRRHIIGAINITMPALLQKRLKTGNLNLLGIIHNNDANHRFKRHWKTHKIVLYDDCSTDLNANPSSFLNLLLEKLRQEGCSACYLLGTFMFLFTMATVHCC